MKTSLSAYELYILVKELNTVLHKAKIEQIYLLENKQLLIQFHVTNAGKKLFTAKVPDYCYLMREKPEAPQTPHGYCSFLRKYLKQVRLVSIQQLGFERIIDMIFQAKEKTYHLIMEFIPPGNIMLCDDAMNILSPLENQQWKDRTIKAHAQYTYPKKAYNFLTLTEHELETLLQATDKENIVKILAIDLGLGGEYAEYLCNLAKVSKGAKKLAKQEIKQLYTAIQALRDHPLAPIVTVDKEIFPFSLVSDQKNEKAYTTLNEALDVVLTTITEKKKQQEQDTSYKSTIGKQQKIIDMQLKQKTRLEEEYTACNKKAELLYQQYQQVQHILEQLKGARKTMSWQEIKAKLKNHKIIKQINEKNNEITLELGE